MAINKLTAMAIRQAKPGEKEYELSDGGGLFLRVRKDGGHLWAYRYTSPTTRKQDRLYLKTGLDLAQARARRDELGSLVAQGVDPKRATVLLDEVGDQIPATVDQLFRIWHKKYVEVNRKRETDRKAIQSRYEQYVKPIMGDLHLPLVRRGHLMRALDGARGNGVKRTTNLVLSEMRQMFSFAVAREWMQGDPTAAIRRKDAGGTEKERDRVLSDDELLTLRGILAKPPVQKSRYYKAIRRVLPLHTELILWWTLATAARAVEIASMRRASVDAEARIWTIPADIAKNEKEHIVHLSDFALAVWSRLEEVAGTEYVFDGRDGGHLSEKEVTRRLSDRQSRAKPLLGRKNTTDLDLPGGRWTQHDLRRTAATIMGDFDVSKEVVDRCLNHVERNKVTRTYQRQKMLPQRRAAFDVLGAQLTAILGDPRYWLPRPVTK